MDKFEDMFIKYKELIPDETIEIIYKRIKRCMDEGSNYDHYLRIFDKLNGGKIPTIIKELIKVK